MAFVRPEFWQPNHRVALREEQQRLARPGSRLGGSGSLCSERCAHGTGHRHRADQPHRGRARRREFHRARFRLHAARLSMVLQRPRTDQRQRRERSHHDEPRARQHWRDAGRQLLRGRDQHRRTRHQRCGHAHGHYVAHHRHSAREPKRRGRGDGQLRCGRARHRAAHLSMVVQRHQSDEQRQHQRRHLHEPAPHFRARVAGRALRRSREQLIWQRHQFRRRARHQHAAHHHLATRDPDSHRGQQRLLHCPGGR